MEAGAPARDEQAARELRGHVDRAGGALRLPPAELARSFGRERLDQHARDAIARVLGDHGVRAEPDLARVDPGADTVLLYVRKPRASKPDLDGRRPAQLALLGLAALALGAGAGLLIAGGGENETTSTTTVTAPAEGGTSEQETQAGGTVTERETNTVTETVTTTETTTVTVPKGPG